MNTYKKRNLLSFLIIICCTFFQETPSYGGFEEDDYDIYGGKSKFGVFHGKDLDAIHQELATHEAIVSSKCGKNNIVFGALSLILKNGDSSRVVTINLAVNSPDGQPSKRKVFESATTYTLYKDAELSQLFSFDENLPSVDILSNHVGKIWGDRGEGGVDWRTKPGLLTRETYIWHDFEFLRKEIEISKENLRSSLTKTALEISSMCFPLSSLALTLETKDHPLSFAQLSVFQEQQGKDGKPSHVLSNLEKIAKKRKTELAAAEKSLKKTTDSFYVYFGHSEQKMLNFLMDDECSIFDELIDSIDEDETVEGVLVHVHSRNNFCQTCRRALIRTSASGGVLRAKLEDRLEGLKSASFYCKVLASFRVMYNPEIKKSWRIWMSYRVTGEQLHPEDLTSDAPQLFLNKVKKDTVEEVQKDQEYHQEEHTPYTFQSGVLFAPPTAASSSDPEPAPPSSSSSSS